jgi:hypothetical protein
MNPVEIKLRRLDAAGTQRDPDFREARRAKKFDEVTLMGQANFGSKDTDERVRSHTGDIGFANAWFVFRITDLEVAGFEPKKGDRVFSVAGRPVNFEVKEARPESPLRGKFLLLYVEVEEVKEERASV